MYSRYKTYVFKFYYLKFLTSPIHGSSTWKRHLINEALKNSTNGTLCSVSLEKQLTLYIKSIPKRLLKDISLIKVLIIIFF